MSDNPPTTTTTTRRRYLQLAAAGTGAVLLGSGTAAAAPSHTNEDVVIRAEQSAHPVDIHATVYRPAGASADDPVPMICHSHGWGGSRTASDGAFRTELDAGFGVLSFDQRGHGDSGGQANVQEPAREGRDVIAILDYVTDLDWVVRSLPKALPIPKKANPMVFAMGGSYGGGYQLVGAFTETRERGYTRFDGLCPEITWFDLPQALAPDAVPRTTWLAALYALGAGMVPEYVHEAFAYSAATGEWPDGDQPGEPDLDARFHGNGPVAFVDDGIRLDVPVLFGQGMTDNLFTFNQAWQNLERGLTDRARARSAVVGYNGGHTLPSLVPFGSTMPSSLGATPADFAAKRLAFFEAIRDGSGDARSVVGSRYRLATARSGRQVAVASVTDRTTYGGVDLTVTGDGAGGLDVANTDTVASSTGAGAPVNLPLAAGPLTVAGVPELRASVTALGVDQRLFAALAVGQSPATARILQNNVMPLNEPAPVFGADRSVTLAGVAADVSADEQLYLTLTAVSDMYPGHGSTRSPGTILLEDLGVGVPLAE